MTLPPLAMHSAAVFVKIIPCPLQEFLPGPALVAVLHALKPLHELAPTHLTCADWGVGELEAAKLGVVRNISATVLARSAPGIVVFFIRTFICLVLWPAESQRVFERIVFEVAFALHWQTDAPF